MRVLGPVTVNWPLVQQVIVAARNAGASACCLFPAGDLRMKLVAKVSTEVGALRPPKTQRVGGGA